MKKTAIKSAVTCVRYPGEPTRYIAWHEWAKKKLKTHRVFKCSQCGLWHIWRRRKIRSESARLEEK